MVERKKELFLDAATSILKEQSEAKVFGQHIGFQLEQVDKHQLIIAQKLIQDVIFNARLGKLKEESYLKIDCAPLQNVPNVVQLATQAQNVSTGEVATVVSDGLQEYLFFQPSTMANN